MRWKGILIVHLIRIFVMLGVAFAFAPDAALAKGPKGCPPGLQKKNPACVPPGQAAKGVTAEEWANRNSGEDAPDEDEEEIADDKNDIYDDERFARLEPGDKIIIDDQEYTVVANDGGILLERNGTVFRLPELDEDTAFVRVGDAIVRVDEKTRALIDIVRLTDLLIS